MSPFEKIEMCRDLVSTVGLEAAAVALAESSDGFIDVAVARELLTQHAPMSGRVVVADPHH